MILADSNLNFKRCAVLSTWTIWGATSSCSKEKKLSLSKCSLLKLTTKTWVKCFPSSAEDMDLWIICIIGWFISSLLSQINGGEDGHISQSFALILMKGAADANDPEGIICNVYNDWVSLSGQSMYSYEIIILGRLHYITCYLLDAFIQEIYILNTVGNPRRSNLGWSVLPRDTTTWWLQWGLNLCSPDPNSNALVHCTTRLPYNYLNFNTTVWRWMYQIILA